MDTLWDQTVIMQSGRVRACVRREDLASQGETLEELFFSITEGEKDARREEE